MDRNLNLGIDFGHDLSLNDLPFSSSGINDVLMQLPSPDALLPLDEIPDSSDQPREQTGGPTLRQRLLEHPEVRVRIRRLIESRQRLEITRTHRLDDDNDGGGGGGAGDDDDDDDAGPRPDPATDPERLMHDIKTSVIRMHKFSDRAIQTESSAEVKNDAASEFDCNICLELAKDPVVTCCGHLFCWPCLYQWLHARRGSKECPVCRGKVKESNLVPIYGRGSSEATGHKNNGEDLDLKLKIPPRPKGKRAENPRQLFRNPLFGRRTEYLYHEVQEMINESFFQRGGRNPQPPRNLQSNPLSTATSPPQVETRTQPANVLQTSAFVDTVTRPRRSVRRRDQERVALTASPSPSQASTSSTMAMIEGESVVPDASLEANNRGGSPMVLRRARNRPSSSSGSSDVNGGSRMRQRRRMN
ncbi:uncharacterized protein A4U43_C08F1170 [Asparagus officinalis]|uniref:putative E3 ubiquitin-protein ligase RING1a n=1 Tax=Asparagus officinalis TaxID=4686 RepID=UPI00098E7431|nr:putative E3 ubiquitin-protein ligase RING1a [Asparagus officinalis]XP_020242477.1 putative E3 ubiquitin-protein ligase RING1a [Asparagus officinalis]XP_020242478.1 putative E3 ubiquitin-protein ligase RING1a [Asparagus officinalis]XP_020242479.1 putative E3 ubiquitin-protein ligase RING1a [Asparagus officinalis]XP_020242480.1 putative E3 ubiquitin-protein ligase RING1a [Asparagus officinalis]ONK58927.1 uncharacterized protein A4U43_C08F1170 [Asparagus officinalis]